MIYMITGKVGGGKTLLALTKIVEQCGKGGCVVSNIAIEERALDKRLRRDYRRHLVDGQIRYHDFEAEPEFHLTVPWGVPELPVMVIVDEAQLYYNAADSTRFAAQLRRLLSFLTQSRKCSVDVWFITQQDTTIWAQFRHQCLFGFKCRDMRAVSLPFVGKVPSLGLGWVKYDIMSGEIMERGRTPLSKDLFSLYDTRQMYDSQMRELQGCAEVWKPVTKNAKGKFEDETVANSVSVRWWAWLLRLAGLFVVRRKESGGDGGGCAESV